MDVAGDLDRSAWQQALAVLPDDCRDCYFTPEYHQLHVANGDGRAFCSVFAEGEARLLVPGLQTPIPGDQCEPSWDLQTCNGYGGPVASPAASAEFLEAAWARWREDCRSRRIVAAFFRLHPLLANERFLPRDARVLRDRQTIFLDLSEGVDALWAAADSRFRNMVNKGRREGVEIVWNDARAWQELASFYGRAMERLNAPASLRFATAYFEALRQLPGAELASVEQNGRLTAVSVFLFGPAWCHYHVSARDPDAGNHLHSVILQAAVERAAERGLRGLHLGGGRSTAADDGLLQFKRSTGGQLCDFNVALVLADRAKYDALCQARQRELGVPIVWLLGYRQPRPIEPTLCHNA